MDQVKVYLGVAKKHHFWILVVLIVIIAVVVWMMATSNLAKAFAANKATIDSAKQSVEKAAATGEDGLLPNRSFKEKVDGMHENLKQHVYQAWEKLYERQAGLFEWPDMDVGRGQPYNIGKEVKPGQNIPGFALTVFNEQYVKNEWKELLESVRIRRPKGSGEEDEDDGLVGIANQPAGGEGPVEYEGLVVWPQESRDEIIERYYTDGTPSTLKVRLTQEDYWLFKSLIGIINEVNGDAADSRKAPIKKIEALDVAQWAIANSREGGSALASPEGTTGPATTGPAAAGGQPASATGAGGQVTPPKPPEAGGAAPAAAAADTANDDQALLSGRYLDDKGQPLLTTGPTNDPYAGPYAEFKQVFVHMRLIMDQRELPELIAACANASLPVETREVRVRMLDAAGPAGGNAFANLLGGMGQMFGGANREGDVETLSYDATVDLSGVIYLYNVPDLAKLGQGTAGSPAKRFFGVPSPSVAVNVPGGRRRAGGGQGMGGGMMGGGMMGGGMMGSQSGAQGGAEGLPGLMPSMPNMQGMQGQMQGGAPGQPPGLMPPGPGMRQGGQ